MLSLNTCLREFVEPVLTCPEGTDLLAIVELLHRAGVDCHGTAAPKHLILVDGQQSPVGVVNVSCLVPHLLRLATVSASDGAIAMPPSIREIEPAIVEPPILLNGALPVVQFIPYLQTETSTPPVVVDAAGHLLGIVDSPRLLHSLIAALPELGQQLNDYLALIRSQADTTSHKRQTTRLVQQLLAQKAELEVQVRSQQATINQLTGKLEMATAIGEALHRVEPAITPATAPTPSPLLHSLLELIERLPLPLMLQASDGHALVENSLWRQQVNQWLDPGWITQEAAAWLKSEITQPPGGSGSEAACPSGTLQMPPEPSPQGGAEQGSVGKHALCHLGPKPGTCICVCPLKNGQEQVLQFIKIPVKGLLTPASLDLPGWFGQPETATTLAAVPAIAPFPESTVISATNPGLHLPTRFSQVGEPPCPWVGMGDPPLTPSRSPEATTSPESLTSADIGTTAATDTFWLVLAQDITEQQHLARELTAKNADLIQLNRLKDEFLACISHELRTPLTAVLGLSSLLKDQTIGEMNQRQMRYAQLIYQSGRHLMAVVNDILDLARMETGQLELTPEPADIPTVCSRAFDQAKQLRLLDDKREGTDNICNLPQFSLDIEPGLDLIVADEQRLRQMLIHLLSNALKFTESDQQIGLKVNRWEGWIAFTVWDRGIGIPADKQHLIFQKFQQLENPLTRKFDGTGLGLVLTQRLARLHGGDVTFTSREGEGSEFTILMPPSPAQPTALTTREDSSQWRSDEYPGGRVPLSSPQNQPASIPQATKITGTTRNRLVLIVEAVVHFIDSLSEQLTGLGYRVVIARSGTEALEKARRLQPCIIFLNPVLPLLSGWDVLTLLKSNQETRQIPVVVTATTVDDAHAHRTYADGFLGLPIQAKALRQMLYQLMVEAKEPVPPMRSPNVLTVLRLSPPNWIGYRSIPAADLTHLLHSQHYRVLEADDLEQAELLARVWKPNVVLLDGTLTDAKAYFQQFSQHTFLTSLPLVTVDQEVTQIANQVGGLLVFPCLAMSTTSSQSANGETSALLQVIQIAAGYAWRPSVLALNLATLPSSLEETGTSTLEDKITGNLPKEMEWLQALIQYLQTAGLRGVLGRSCQEVLQQVQSQSVDLIIVCWTKSKLQPATLQMLAALQQLPAKPPIVVLDHRHDGHNNQPQTPIRLPKIVRQLATKVLSPSLSMAEMLDECHQLLKG